MPKAPECESRQNSKDTFTFLMVAITTVHTTTGKIAIPPSGKNQYFRINEKHIRISLSQTFCKVLYCILCIFLFSFFKRLCDMKQVHDVNNLID